MSAASSRTLLQLFAIACAVAAVDIATKYWAQGLPPPGEESLSLVLQHAHLGEGRWYRTLFVVGLLVFAIFKAPLQIAWLRVSLAVAIGAGSGNAIEMAMTGSVTDWIMVKVHLWRFTTTTIFNAADVFLLVAGVALALAYPPLKDIQASDPKECIS